MKRPLFLVGCSYLTGMAAAFYFGYGAALVWIGLATIVAVFCGFFLEESPFRMAALVALSASCGLVWSLLFTLWRAAPLTALEDQTITVTGTVMEQKRSGTVMIHTVEGYLEDYFLLCEPIRMEILTHSDTMPRPGDTIQAEIKVTPSVSDTVYGRNKLSKGIYLSGFANGEPLFSSEPVSPIYSFIARYRARLIETVRRLIPDSTGDLLAAILYGDRSRLTDNQYDTMAKAGLAHVIAISGLHLSVSTGLLTKLLKTLRFSARKVYLFTIVGGWGLAILSGLGYPVIRAAILLTVYYVGLLIGRRSDSLNSLGFAAIVIGTWNPLSVGNISMQLSFLSTMGMLVFGEPIETRLEQLLMGWLPKAPRLVKSISGTLAFTLAAQLLTLPLVYLYFGYFSLSSFLSNPLVLPLLPILLGFGYLASCLGLIPGFAFIAGMVMKPAVWGLKLMVVIADLAARLPLQIYCNDLYLLIWMVSAAGLAFILWKSKASIFLWKSGAVLWGISLMIALITWKLAMLDTVRLVSYGESGALLMVRGNRCVIVGTDPLEDILLDELDRHGIRQVDLLILPDQTFTQGDAAAKLILAYQPVNLVAPDDPACQSYLSAVATGELRVLSPMDLEMLGGIRARLEPGMGMDIKIGETNLLKFFDIYGIIEPVSDKVTGVIESDGSIKIVQPRDVCRFRQLSSDKGQMIVRFTQ